jgi:hypothetical protein
MTKRLCQGGGDECTLQGELGRMEGIYSLLHGWRMERKGGKPRQVKTVTDFRQERERMR